jgi:predicted dehydrogenase
MRRPIIALISALLLASCGSGGGKTQTAVQTLETMENNYQVRLSTVDPGHFHAALIQKTMYPQISPQVHVYAPEGPDVMQHLKRITSYNTRKDNPTSWDELVYTGDDFFDKMLSEKTGNVVVLSGNNKKKAEYITRSIDAGLNVLADKPMIISPGDFPKLEAAFNVAKEKGVLLYDIMTERFEITSVLQKLLSHKETIFGKLETGTMDEPAVSKVSVHHFSKIVSGTPLQRPAWFFDVDQQGEGIVDVTTHLVDLVQWGCFPEQILRPSDVNMVSAKRWPTIISKEEFKGVTGYEDFPEFLQKDIKDGKLNVYSNGEMIYRIKGIWVKVSVTWNYMPPAGGGDTHYSVMRGSKCNLVIRQGADEKFLPTLYIEKIKGISMPDFTSKLKEVLSSLPYDSLQTETVNSKMLKIIIPKKYRVSHEEHFGQVTVMFLEYMKEGKLPDWEVPGMITKYYTTTSALKLAKE